MTSHDEMFDLIHESNKIEGFDDPKMDEASMIAWKSLLNVTRLTDNVIKELHEAVTKHQNLNPQWRGVYRSDVGVNVRVGDRICPRHEEVDEMLSNWLKMYRKRPYDAKKAHIHFEHIHPFVDGNGRVGRLLMWWMEVKNGEKPTMIAYRDRWDYYDWFR